MVKAEYADKSQAVDILTKSFDTNKSINYIIKQDKGRKRRIKILMEYSFDMCWSFWDIFLSEDKKACALLLLPDKKRTNLKTISWDLKLIASCIGLSNLFKAIKRESEINKLHPEELMYYLWFIGVDPVAQHQVLEAH